MAQVRTDLFLNLNMYDLIAKSIFLRFQVASKNETLFSNALYVMIAFFSDTESRQSTLHYKALPSPVQEKVPMTAPEEVVVTVEDIERAMVNL